MGGAVWLAMAAFFVLPSMVIGQGAAETPAAGKAHQQLPIDESLKQSRYKISPILRADNFGPGDEQLLETYYRKYSLPQWTLPQNYSSLPKFRNTLRSEVASTKGGPIRDKLNSVLLDQLSQMANGNFDPTVRYNAMLMIGDLNVRPPASATDDPQPLPAALPVLTAALEDKNQIDAVRIAALWGIRRHVKLGIADAEAQKVAAAMLKLATTKDAADRSAAGHAWMRGRAIEILGRLKSVGAQGAVAKAMVAMISESGDPLSVRCAAAWALGNLNLDQQTGLDPVAAIRALGELAVAACKDEVAQCKKEKRLISPRNLKASLVSVRIGLTGDENGITQPPKALAALATKQEDQGLRDEILGQIGKWLEKLDNKDLNPKPEAEDAASPLGTPAPSADGASPDDPAVKASDQVIKELTGEAADFEKRLHKGS